LAERGVRQLSGRSQETRDERRETRDEIQRYRLEDR
jgi:hypothetical protein